MAETKRRPPPALQKLLQLDVSVTKTFVKWANQFLPLRSLTRHYKMLEVSCHGILWLTSWISFTWLFDNPRLVQMQVNILMGLVLDIIFLSIIKAYVRRRRPSANIDDQIAQMGPDKFSFPSGHASRAVFVAYFFINLYPLPIYVCPPLLAWATSVCLSRVLLNRHYILDVLGGVVLGLLEGVLLGVLWLGNDTAMWLLNYISDEKMVGGEYHV